MKFLNWPTIRLVLMLALVVFLFSFTSIRNKQRKLTKSEVLFTDNSNLFVTSEMVNKLLIENKKGVSSIEKDKLNLKKLENVINSNPMIEKSEVFVSIDGVLKAVVKQRTPIGRVFNKKGSFYIDYQGSEMPLSDLYSARVPLVSGEITKQNEKEIGELLRFIYDDVFLKENIIGIQILPTTGLLLKNRNFKYDIDFGKPMNVEKKFNTYKAFYQKAVLDSSITNYKRISLRFTQQVVCTK